jgi:hypothetical protein
MLGLYTEGWIISNQREDAMSNTAVLLEDIDLATLRREVDAKIQRFTADAQSAPPAGGERKSNNFRALQQSISGLAGQQEVLVAVNGDGGIEVGELSAVCFVGAQDTILLRIFYRVEQRVLLQYEYALCVQRRGQSPVKWTDAKAFLREYARRTTVRVPVGIDMGRTRSSATELLETLRTGGPKKVLFRGAELTAAEVEHQIKGLRPLFVLGDNAATLDVGSYKAACFLSDGSVLKLRVFRSDPSGWLHATYQLSVEPNRPAAHRRLRGAGGTKIRYNWRSA